MCTIIIRIGQGMLTHLLNAFLVCLFYKRIRSSPIMASSCTELVNYLSAFPDTAIFMCNLCPEYCSNNELFLDLDFQLHFPF